MPLSRPHLGSLWCPSSGPVPLPISMWLSSAVDGAGSGFYDFVTGENAVPNGVPVWGSTQWGPGWTGDRALYWTFSAADREFFGKQGFTWHCIFKTGTSVTTGDGIFYQSSGGENNCVFFATIYGGGGFHAYLHQNNVGGPGYLTMYPGPNTWYNFVVTYSPADLYMRLYQNGVFSSLSSGHSGFASYPADALPQGTGRIGDCSGDSDDQWGNGLLPFIATYAECFTAEQVAIIYADPFAAWRAPKRLWWYATGAAPDLQTYTRAVDAWGSDAQVLTRAVAVYGSAVGALTAAVGACGADPQAVTRLLASYGYEAQALTRAGEAWGRDAQTIARAMEGYGADPGTLTKALVSFGFDFVTATRAVEAWASDPQTLTRALAAYGVDPLTLTRALDASGADPQALTRVLAAYGADSRAIEFAVALWGSNPQVLSPAMVAWAGDLRTLTLVVGAYGSLIATATAAIEAYGVDPGTYTRALAAFGSQLEAYTRELAAWGSDPQAASRGFEAWGVGGANTLLASMMAWAQSTGLLTFGAEAWGSLRVTGTVGLELWGASGAAAAGWLRAVLESGRYN